MPELSRRDLLASLLAAPAAAQNAGSGWVPLFDGRTLNGWKAGGNASSWKVVDGAIAADGPTSHLFYTGAIRNADFRNFELKAEVLTKPLCNSGIYFHTRYQAAGFPDEGFEVQVNNTALGAGQYRERKKTASLYGVRDVYKQLVRDGEWFRIHVAVRGKRVQIRLNDMLVVDYIEPDPPVREDVKTGRVLDRGTFALQCHDPGSKAFFRNILVKPLRDDLPTEGQRPAADAGYRDILWLNAHNYPTVDYHVHLKGGLTLEEALDQSRRLGIGYGIAVNCGLNFPVQTDAGAEDFLRTLEDQPVFVAMQAEGREWMKLFSRRTIAKFDYVFTDAMTWSDDNGRRMRLWIPEEVPRIHDKQRFMDMLVSRTVSILSGEPIDIFANPTFLPDQIAREYDELWTPERMERVIEAAVKNDVAIELNNRYSLPRPQFVKAAKKAGAKFSFGTNNTDRNLGRLEYSVRMVKECGLGWADIFVPKPDGDKPAQRRA